MNPRSRAHRILNDLDLYQPTVGWRPSSEDQEHIRGDLGVELGVYLNPDRSRVLFFENGIATENTGEDRVVYYNEIKDVPLPEGPKLEWYSVTLVDKKGERIDLPVQGGEDGIRESSEVLRFFRRVVEDIRKWPKSSLPDSV